MTRPELVQQRAAPAQIAAGVFGAGLLVVGLVGLADGGSWHPAIHIATGLLLLAGLGSNSRARSLCRLIGLAYLVVTIAGIADGHDVFGLFTVDTTENVLHALLALALFVAAAMSKDKRDTIARDRVVVRDDSDGSRVVGPGSGHVGGPRAIGPRIDRRLPVKKHP